MSKNEISNKQKKQSKFIYLITLINIKTSKDKRSDNDDNILTKTCKHSQNDDICTDFR